MKLYAAILIAIITVTAFHIGLVTTGIILALAFLIDIPRRLNY